MNSPSSPLQSCESPPAERVASDAPSSADGARSAAPCGVRPRSKKAMRSRAAALSAVSSIEWADAASSWRTKPRSSCGVRCTARPSAKSCFRSVASPVRPRFCSFSFSLTMSSVRGSSPGTVRTGSSRLALRLPVSFWSSATADGSTPTCEMAAETAAPPYGPVHSTRTTQPASSTLRVYSRDVAPGISRDACPSAPPLRYHWTVGSPTNSADALSVEPTCGRPLIRRLDTYSTPSSSSMSGSITGTARADARVDSGANGLTCAEGAAAGCGAAGGGGGRASAARAGAAAGGASARLAAMAASSCRCSSSTLVAAEGGAGAAKADGLSKLASKLAEAASAGKDASNADGSAAAGFFPAAPPPPPPPSAPAAAARPFMAGCRALLS